MEPMIDKWIAEIKRECDPGLLGMILVHDGIVRATSKTGEPVRAMNLSCDRELLEKVVGTFRAKEGIVAIKVWINEGDLQIGDDIMKVCVAGRFRTDILPVFEELLTIIKRDVVQEDEEPNL